MKQATTSIHLYFSILIISIILFSCDKPADPVIPDPNPVDTTDTEEYAPPFEKVPETGDIIMYEVNLRAFSSSGKLDGVTQKLDSIKAMGINVIWLMPIYPIGIVNSVGQMGSPYSVRNYKEVNPELGNLEDLRTLVKKAHEKEMAVILDWVANHTAWDHPWISEHKDWYSQDANGNIIIPPGTNWQDVADLNYNNQEMRLAMIDAMKFWIIETNIDGFRCDYADGIPYNFWKQAIDTLDKFDKRDIILLAEGNRNDHFTAGFQMTYSWDFYGKLKQVFAGTAGATELFTTNQNETGSLPAGAYKLRYTTNHDESAWDKTPVQLYGGKKGALSASVIAICMGGVPLIYSSQEVGRENTLPFFSRDPINWSLNPDMKMEYKKILNYYSGSEVLKSGQMTKFNNSNVVAFLKVIDQDSLLVLANVRNSQVSFTASSALIGTSWTDVLTQQEINLTQFFAMDPYQYLILKKN